MPSLRRTLRILIPALVMALAVFADGSCLQAAAEEGGFASGNQLYAAGKFAEAAQAYEAQVKRGDYRANLFYNLGDAYYRLGNRGRAILNYRRALLLEPAQAEATANLAFVGGGRSAANGGINVSDGALCWLIADTVWIIACGALTCWVSRRWRALGAVLIFMGTAASLVGAGLLWQTLGTARYGPRALVVDADVPAHYSPADNSKVVTRLSAGAEVQVLSAQGAWIYALLEDGTRAWVSSDQVERLIPPR